MDKVVIVTGASGGLGSAVAKRFGKAGAKVVVHYNRSGKDPENTAKEINSSSGEAFTCQADVRNFTQVKEMVDRTIARWSRIDVLVNAAGGPFGVWQPLYQTDEELWDLVVDSNLKGTFNCIKAVLPQMIEQRDGHIINLSSGAALLGVKGRASYGAAKAGVLGLTKAVAMEVGEYNIKVNALCPGLILHGRMLAKYPPDREQAIKNENLLHRTGTPEEFADFVFHLSTMNNISGQTINLDSRIIF